MTTIPTASYYPNRHFTRPNPDWLAAAQRGGALTLPGRVTKPVLPISRGVVYPPVVKKYGGNPVAVASGILTAVKAVDTVARMSKAGTRIEAALDKKYEGREMPKLAKGVRAVAHWTKEKFGWGPAGEKIDGAESEKELEASIRAAWESAGKTWAAAKKAGALAWKSAKKDSPPAKNVGDLARQAVNLTAKRGGCRRKA